MENKIFIEKEIGGKYDPRLDEFVKNNPNPFPKQLARATELIEKYGLPEELMQPQKRKKLKSKHKIPVFTPLQKELLDVYDFSISEDKMLQIKVFLQQLLADEIAENAEKNQNLVGLAA